MTKLTYEQALHGMQSGVAFEHSQGSPDGSPKHLRVGINSAHVNNAAIARLLIDKNIITMDEYEEAVRVEMVHELERYEARAGNNITFR